MYPPTVKDTQVEMIYPPHVPEHLRFAVGQEVFGLVPGLMMYATIWLREHNRVCDVLKQEHPEWDDERLFQTSRLILIGKQEEKTLETETKSSSAEKTNLLPLRYILSNSGRTW